MKCSGFLLFCCATTAALAYDYPDVSHRYSIIADFVYFKRAHVGNRSIVKDSSEPQLCSCSDFTVMEAEDPTHRFSLEPGYRLGFWCMFDRHNSLEGNYTWVSGWEGGDDQHGDGTLYFPFRGNGGSRDMRRADSAFAHYDSHFQSAEINYWRHVTPRFGNYFSCSWIAGLRWIALDETFLLGFIKGRSRSDYKIEAWNLMGGVQAGLDLQVNPYRWMYWELVPKIGILLNRGQQETFLGDRNNRKVLRDFEVSRYQDTLLVQADASVHIQPWTCFDVHVGYEFIYLNAVALAPDQISKGTGADSGEKVNMSEYVTIYGLFVGTTFNF